MNTKEYIQQVVDYIEDHIEDIITVDTLSNEVGFSKFYLHRLFNIYSGLSLIEYARKRKLNHAMLDLHSHRRIIDIALTYGYSSERSFSRAFVTEFGHSPSYFRNQPFLVSEKLIIRDIRLPKKEGLNTMYDYLSDVSYKTIKEMTVISGKNVGSEPEETIIKIMGALKNELQLTVSREFGFDVPVNEELSAKGYRGYEYWLVVPPSEATNLLAGKDHIRFQETEITVKVIPSYRYISLRITDPFENPFEKIPSGWKTLVAWMEENQVICSPIPADKQLDCMEEVIDIDGITYMDIFIPIDRG